MEYVVDVCQLTSDFYNDYPPDKFPELMYKDNRPYTCLLIETSDNYFICIPFRSHIPHNDAFIFKLSNRSTRTRSGLDYQKTVIVKDDRYIETSKATVVDKDEYNEMMINIEQITDEINEYVSRYINHVSGISSMHYREYQRHYQFTTLQYFNDILIDGENQQ